MTGPVGIRLPGWAWTAISLAMLCAFLFPIYWMITSAIKPTADVFALPPKVIPTAIDFSAFTEQILADERIPRYFLNSAIVSSFTAILTLLLAAPAAFALAHLRLRGKSLLILVSLSSLMFPAVMLATPLFVIFNRFGLTDSYVGLIIANTALALPFALVVLRPFFLALPKELNEAARMDGCTAWGAFGRVMMPLATPGIVTAGIFSFLFAWNDLVFALALTTGDRYRPVTAGLWNFIGPNLTDWNAVMAFSTLAMLPPLFVFLFLQRYIVSGLTAGAIK